MDPAFEKLLKEPDMFKLAIRGHAAIEDLLERGIAEAFEGEAPAELRRLPFRTRLALFAALVRLPDTYCRAIGLLAQLRHDFAHGRIEELTPQRAEELAAQLRPIGPPAVAEFYDTGNPRVILVTGLTAAYIAADAAMELAEKRRHDQQAAINLRTELRRLVEKHGPG
jgi:hypothetical protein